MPRALADFEAESLQEDFPDMDIQYVQVVLEVGEDRNCVAYALGEEEHAEPGTVMQMRDLFLKRDYIELSPGDAASEIDLLGDTDADPPHDKVYVTHCIKKWEGGTPPGVPNDVELWVSKLGPGDMAITHRRKDLCKSGQGMQRLGPIIASFKKKSSK